MNSNTQPNIHFHVDMRTHKATPHTAHSTKHQNQQQQQHNIHIKH